MTEEEKLLHSSSKNSVDSYQWFRNNGVRKKSNKIDSSCKIICDDGDVYYAIKRIDSEIKFRILKRID